MHGEPEPGDAVLRISSSRQTWTAPGSGGGVPGYSDLKVILADPAHEEHHAVLKWLELRSATEFALPVSRRTRPTRGC